MDFIHINLFPIIPQKGMSVTNKDHERILNSLDVFEKSVAEYKTINPYMFDNENFQRELDCLKFLEKNLWEMIDETENDNSLQNRLWNLWIATKLTISKF